MGARGHSKSLTKVDQDLETCLELELVNHCLDLLVKFVGIIKKILS